METAFKTNTNIGLGFAVQSDPFQSGREAAQMAKRQFPEGNVQDLVVAFGPKGIHFQHFIEGVRLVTGEKALVGLPVERILSAELPSPQTCVVLIIQSATNQFTLASTDYKDANSLASATALFSEFRKVRGNTQNQYEHHGILLFDNNQNQPSGDVAELISLEAGLESWVIKCDPTLTSEDSFICHDKVINKGMVGLEFFSDLPVGIGHVPIGSFKDPSSVIKDTFKSAVRNAQTQLGDNTPSFGFLLFQKSGELAEKDLGLIFNECQGLIKNAPLIGIETVNSFVRQPIGMSIKENDSAVALLFPS